jgi:hypothetical protein
MVTKKIKLSEIKQLIKEEIDERFSFESSFTDKEVDYANSRAQLVYFKPIIKSKDKVEINEVSWIVARNAKLFWNIEFGIQSINLKSSGIDSVSVKFDNFVCDLEVECSYGEEDEKTDKFDYAFDAKALKFKFAYEGGFKNGQLIPNNITIDFGTKTVTVYFFN